MVEARPKFGSGSPIWHVCVVLVLALLEAGRWIGADAAAPSTLGVAYGDYPPFSSNPLSRDVAIQTIKDKGVINIRLYNDVTDPSDAASALKAISGKADAGWSPKAMLTIPNARIQQLASGGYVTDFLAAVQGLESVVGSVAVSNEPDSCCANGDQACCAAGSAAAYLNLVKQAVDNVIAALKGTSIRVTVPFSQSVLSGCFPPSTCTVKPELQAIVAAILQSIQAQGSNAFMTVNIYPFSAWSVAPPSYVLGEPGASPVYDGPYAYTSMFDAMYDSVRVGINSLSSGAFASLPIAVGETGWPTDGNAAFANSGNACNYNNYFVRRVYSGLKTPRWMTPITAYIFEMFDEPLKCCGTEPHFGVYNQDGSTKYTMDWTGTGSGAPTCPLTDPQPAPRDLSVQMSVVNGESPAAPETGEAFTYIIKVAGASSSSSPSNVRLVDVLPPGLTFLSVMSLTSKSSYGDDSSGPRHGGHSGYSTCRYSRSSRTVTCKWSKLAAGAVQTVYIKVKASEAGSFDNTATAYSDSTPGGVTASVNGLVVCTHAGGRCSAPPPGGKSSCCSGSCSQGSSNYGAACYGRRCTRRYNCK